MENDLIFDKLKKFILEQGFGYALPFPFLFKKRELTRETRLEMDLRITGDEAGDFLTDFSKEFNVDVSMFPIGHYFKDESDFITRMFIRKNSSDKELTIADLIKAIQTGRLIG